MKKLEHICNTLEAHGWITANGFAFFGGATVGFYTKGNRTIRVTHNKYGVFARFHN